MSFVEIVFQTDWTDKVTLDEILSMASHCDTKLLLGWNSIKSALDSKEFLPLSRLIYFLTGAYDSIVFQSEIEIAGIDQEFIVLLSRALQSNYSTPVEIGLLAPHLIGSNGKKMGNSENNCIYLSDSVEKIREGIAKLPKESIQFAKEVEKNILSQ